ncbi:OPT oligopeptide transporter [Mycena kentingensis (nom. inval.)]|nr:OPT oligopeptide transporter [Mycena kentingensis (nom. inval.)]
MQHLRWSAFVGEDGSWRDGLAETFYLYSQNLPTVALLLPRAGLALSLMLAFSVPDAGFVALADAGLNRRDKTFFRIHDGTLTSYAHGVLYANVAWALWRVIVLLVSWIGLWILSGAGCAGLCGPRNRWEEDAAEKTLSVYSDNVSALESLPWKWREATFLRVQTAFEFCLTLKPRWSRSEKAPEDTTEPISPSFPFTPPPARGIVLSGTFGDMIPKIVKRPSKDVQDDAQGPLTRLPYPFAGPSAQRSSQDMVPFPPSPRPSAEQRTTRDSPDGQEEVEDDAYQSTGTGTGSSDDPAVRTSASMSSLGQPIVSRYPFRFRSSTHGSSQSNTHSHSQSASSGPRRSVLSHSSGSYSASPSSFIGPDPFGLPLPPRHPQAPVRGRSRAGTVPMPSVATSGSGSGSGSSIGMPPPTPLDFPRRPRASTVSRATSSGSGSDLQPRSSSPQPQPGLNPNESYGDAESVSAGSHEHDGEREDQLGLLMGNSASSSPRTSLGALRQRASNLSLSSWVQQRRMTRYSGSNSGSGSGSHSRAQSHSGSASSSGRSRAGSLSVVRSRAQSLLQNLGGAPSFDSAAMRLRASSSVGRLEDISDSEHARARVASSANTHSRSGSGSDGLLSDVENNTFGHPLRPHLPAPSPVPESPLEHP